MNHTKLIQGSIEQAKKALADLVVSTEVKKISSVYNNSTGKATETPVSQFVDMAITHFRFNEVDGTNVRSDDLKGIIFDVSVNLDMNDMVVIGGIQYKVVNVIPTLSGTTVVLLEVQLRR